MKLKLAMVNAEAAKTTKTFDNLPETTSVTNLKALGNAYILLTDQVSTVATKVVETVLELDE